MKKILIVITTLFILLSCSNKNSSTNYYYNNEQTTLDYSDWYSWAENNNIDDFEDCDSEFWSSYDWAEDWCNEYIQENNSYSSTSFWSYECTEDCSWHEAGYQWAEDNWIDDEYYCNWNSNSFIEWCTQYVNDNY